MTACKGVYQRGSYNTRTGEAVCDSCGQSMPCPQPGQMPPHEMVPLPDPRLNRAPPPQPKPLPPEVVAGIDGRLAGCDQALQALIKQYRTMAAAHGTAGATGAIAGELYSTQLRGIGNVVDVLAYAISRLAEKPDQ